MVEKALEALYLAKVREFGWRTRRKAIPTKEWPKKRLFMLKDDEKKNSFLFTIFELETLLRETNNEPLELVKRWYIVIYTINQLYFIFCIIFEIAMTKVN